MWCSELQPQLQSTVIQLVGDKNLVYKIKCVTQAVAVQVWKHIKGDKIITDATKQ